MRLTTIASLIILALLSTGCVTKQTHEATLQELNKTRDSLGSAQKTIDEQQMQIQNNEKELAQDKEELARSKKQIELNNNEITDLDLKKEVLQREFDAAQERLNASQAKLKESQMQLETMRKIEAETQKRNEIYARFVQELQKMIDGGQLTVTIEQGRIVINLPENVLFPTASATVNRDGTEALKQIANVLKEFADRRFQIEGHTDNQPVGKPWYSNLALSEGRARLVGDYIRGHHVAEASKITQIGYGAIRPLDTNETAEGRYRNRRAEISIIAK